MAILDWPEDVGIAEAQCTLDQVSQVFRSAYTGAVAKTANPWHGKWLFAVSIIPMVGDRNVRALRAFLASLRGQINSVRLPVTCGEQKHLPMATVQATVAKGGTSMTITGCFLQPGQLLTVNDQLVSVVTSEPSGSNCAITFQPALRADASAGTAVETGNPTSLVMLSSSSVSWTLRPGNMAYPDTLNFEEDF